MEVSEVKDKKQKLEQEILDLLTVFSKETETEIQDIELSCSVGSFGGVERVSIVQNVVVKVGV